MSHPSLQLSASQLLDLVMVSNYHNYHRSGVLLVVGCYKLIPAPLGIHLELQDKFCGHCLIIKDICFLYCRHLTSEHCMLDNYLESKLNSIYNKVAFNIKLVITKENLCTKYFLFTYKYIALNEKPPIMKENLCIFFSL